MKLSSRILPAALVAASLLASPVHAQWGTLAAGTISNNGGEFWDRTSSDGATCNVGFVLTGGASTRCGNQRPTNWLPYTGPSMNEYRVSNAGFPLFTQNPLGLSVTLYGDIAGQNTEWGVFNGANTGDRFNMNAAFLAPGSTTGGALGLNGTWTSWGFYIRGTNGNYYYSNVDQQFAFFRNTSTGEYALGMEDIFVGQNFDGGDRDYNDVLITFSLPDGSVQVPEPASFALLGVGMFGLVSVARRRSRNR